MSAQGSGHSLGPLDDFELAIQDATESVIQFNQALASGRGGVGSGAGGTGGAGGGGGAGRGRGGQAGALALGFIGGRLAGLGRRVGRNTASFVAGDLLRNDTGLGDSLLNAGVRAFDPLGINEDVTGAQDATLRRAAGVLVPLARAGVAVTDEQRNAVTQFFAGQEIRAAQEMRELRRVSSENLAAFTSLNPLTQGVFGQTVQGIMRGLGLVKPGG